MVFLKHLLFLQEKDPLSLKKGMPQGPRAHKRQVLSTSMSLVPRVYTELTQDCYMNWKEKNRKAPEMKEMHTLPSSLQRSKGYVRSQQTFTVRGWIVNSLGFQGP